ncbi:MAG: phosphoenolpyruvate carboxykinase (ATP) [Candidatus Marinimicrobia bacterium]|nr:phosphoenolpyruvate carboxykinase (ATP) [Candidatus Neomarinimicrobiota bacterium]
MNYKELGLDKLGFEGKHNIFRNLPIEKIIEHSLLNGETKMGMNGATMVDTGEYTGRSPKDKFFVVEPKSKDKLWWGAVNSKVDISIFDELYDKVINFYNINSNTKTYIFDGFAGADTNHTLPIRIICKKAWQNHFCHNMFIRPTKNQLEGFKPDFTIINASDVENDNYKKHNLHSKTFIIFNLARNIAIIGGTEYGGEMKKGIFSILHYLLPQKGILSMHCSANTDLNNENSALFFGLSGTGKTTLSTDPNRPLIGDDEHGWSDDGIFNFEGGCYAKTINLNKEDEPDIYNAIRHGALIENVVFDSKSREIDFSDGSKTENTRVSYPIHHIGNSLMAKGMDSLTGHPNKIIFLTCDAFGILPAISKLSPGQAMYHFISGYTAKVAGTERGITEPQATFSPCYGGPFLTLHPLVYAELLKQKIKDFDVPVYLVNTGWIGGSPSSGAKRISIKFTRLMISSILNGDIDNSDYIIDPIFGLSIPKSIPNIPSDILDPRMSWSDKNIYDREAIKLSNLFKENFKQYGDSIIHLEKHGPK